MSQRTLSKAVQAVVKPHIRSNERVEAMIPGLYKQAIIVTNQRVIVAKGARLFGLLRPVRFTDWPLASITGISVFHERAVSAVIVQAPGDYRVGLGSARTEAANAIAVDPRDVGYINAAIERLRALQTS